MKPEKSQEETPIEFMMSQVFGLDMDEEDIIRRGIPEERLTDILESGQVLPRGE